MGDFFGIDIFSHILSKYSHTKRRTETSYCPEHSQTVCLAHTCDEPAKQVESRIYFWSILSCRMLLSNLKLVVASGHLSWCYFRSKTSWRPRWCSFPIRPGQTFLVPVKVRQVRSWKKTKSQNQKVHELFTGEIEKRIPHRFQPVIDIFHSPIRYQLLQMK